MLLAQMPQRAHTHTCTIAHALSLTRNMQRNLTFRACACILHADIHRSGELYLNQDMEDFGEDEQWLDERHEVYDDGIDTVGDLPVVDKMRVRHFSFGGLRSKQVHGRAMHLVTRKQKMARRVSRA